MDWATLWELFKLPIVAAFMAGAVVPLVGCFLFLRRTSFYGLALPQFAAAGVALGFVLMPAWVARFGLRGLDIETALADTHAAMNYHLAWASAATFGGLAALVALGRRGGNEVARVAVAFALASAATVLCAHASPIGEIFVTELLRGEILAVGIHELETLAVALGVTLALFLWLGRDLVLVSFDPETAQVLGKPVWLFELALAGATGLCVSAASLTVGPVVLFGLLVVPPVAVRPFARSMPTMLGMSSAMGLLAVAAGIWGSFHYDLPLGPCVVVAAGGLAAPALLARPAGR
jgi:zinc transport system permease protein